MIELLLPLMVGASVYIEGNDLSQKAGLVKETVDKERVTTLLFTPYVWNNILKSEWTNSRNNQSSKLGRISAAIYIREIDEYFR